jgi:hypothetical protein
MLFVAALSLGQRQQDLALLPSAPSRQIPGAPPASACSSRILGWDSLLIRCLTTKHAAVHWEESFLTDRFRSVWRIRHVSAIKNGIPPRETGTYRDKDGAVVPSSWLRH